MESVMLRLIAAGLPAWYDEMTEFNFMLNLKNLTQDDDEMTRPLGMAEFSDLFFAFECLLGFTFIIFLIEIIVFKYY